MKTILAVGLSAGLLVAFLGCSRSKSYPGNPTEVLSTFLEADSQAAALSPQTSPDLTRLTTWSSAPAWDTFIVINGYELGKARIGTTRAEILVTYHQVGQMGTRFTPGAKREPVEYHLNKIDGFWKVDVPRLPPHVSSETLLKRLDQDSTDHPAHQGANQALSAQIATTEQGAR